MTAIPPSSVPAQLTAGDTAIWQHAGGDYPASAGWSLAYTFISAADVYQVAGTANGDDYLVTVQAATTATWNAGIYRVQEYVTNGSGERHTLRTYTVQVLPNLAAATAGMDTRTHAQKVLDSINGWLETKAPIYGAMEINNRKISYIPIPDLLMLRDRYRAEVANEQRGRGARILAVL